MDGLSDEDVRKERQKEARSCIMKTLEQVIKMSMADSCWPFFLCKSIVAEQRPRIKRIVHAGRSPLEGIELLIRPIIPSSCWSCKIETVRT